MPKTKDQLKTARKSRRTKHKNDSASLKNRKNWYPVYDNKRSVTRKCKTPRVTKLRSNITPGTILILLAGRFRGRRVVFLKQLKSGLLLVTGPYKLNGVPLKRVNQAYVIATKTSVKLGSVPQVDKIDDKFFNKVILKRNELGEVVMPKNEDEKRARVAKERKDTQQSVDTEVKKAVLATPFLKEYLQNRFALKNGQQVHNLVF